ADTSGGFAVFAAGTGTHGCVGDFFKNFVAFHQFPESGVLVIEGLGGAVADEKLAARRVWICRASHGDDAAHVWAVVELRFDGIPRTARPPLLLLARILGQRVAALNHETLD